MATDTGTITSVGATAPVALGQEFNLSLSGFGSATVALERSFDSGVTWGVIEVFTGDAERIGQGHEMALYRFNCSVYASGPLAYRLKG